MNLLLLIKGISKKLSKCVSNKTLINYKSIRWSISRNFIIPHKLLEIQYIYVMFFHCTSFSNYVIYFNFKVYIIFVF